MQLDDLKKSMSTLDDILAEKSVGNIHLDTETCANAQNRVMSKYRKGALSCAILAVVYLIGWNVGLGKDAFPLAYKLYLGIYLVIATLWYSYLYVKTKKINIAVYTPMQTLKQVSTLRLYTLTGEIVLGMAMAVFFTLFLSNLWVVGRYRFWVIIAATVVYTVLLITIFIPRTIRDFKNLSAIE